MTTEKVIQREADKSNLVGIIARESGAGKLNPRWVETLMGLPVGWVMPSCQNPITPQGYASPNMGGGWMTPEAQNSTGYHMSNGKKILKLGSQVMENFASHATTELMSFDSLETELSPTQQQ